jgi:hypothetical protein
VAFTPFSGPGDGAASDDRGGWVHEFKRFSSPFYFIQVKLYHCTCR